MDLDSLPNWLSYALIAGGALLAVAPTPSLGKLRELLPAFSKSDAVADALQRLRSRAIEPGKLDADKRDYVLREADAIERAYAALCAELEGKA